MIHWSNQRVHKVADHIYNNIVTVTGTWTREGSKVTNNLVKDGMDITLDWKVYRYILAEYCHRIRDKLEKGPERSIVNIRDLPVSRDDFILVAMKCFIHTDTVLNSSNVEDVADVANTLKIPSLLTEGVHDL